MSDWKVPSTCVDISQMIPRPTPEQVSERALKRALERGATLNSPERPVGSFCFYCTAPDVKGYGTEQETHSVFLNGKRVARLSFEYRSVDYPRIDGVGPGGFGFSLRKRCKVNTELLAEPEEIESGSVLLFPQADAKEKP